LSGDVTIRVSPLDDDDLELVLAWRSNPDIYRYFRDQDSPLVWSEHVRWYESRPTDRHDFVVHYDGRRVGVVTIDTNDAVGIYLGDFSARGHGVATAALGWLCDRFHDREPLLAEIHRENESSLRLFERCGFRQRGRDEEWFKYAYES
jgi:RimJ/RimL family protein N-acetyltransferase